MHHVLGRHRDDDPRKGWLSGLSEEEGEAHPTIGGLRIGKRLGERKEDEAPDPRLEWDQDGQYYHYLTKWMHALVRVGKRTGDPRYIVWAVELAKTAHEKFTYMAPGGRRMFWKMSIDLSRPLVPSMGQHDPLDGYVTYSEIQNAMEEIAEMPDRCRGMSLVPDDPLGLGGLLFDASRLAQLSVQGVDHSSLLGSIGRAALIGLEAISQDRSLTLPSEYHLAFRELGLVIGLGGVEMILECIDGNLPQFAEGAYLLEQFRSIKRYAHLGKEIEHSWISPEGRQTITWQEHREINMVMLATSIAPGEFLRV